MLHEFGTSSHTAVWLHRTHFPEPCQDLEEPYPWLVPYSKDLKETDVATDPSQIRLAHSQCGKGIEDV